jgi:hypothetical protein
MKPPRPLSLPATVPGPSKTLGLFFLPTVLLSTAWAAAPAAPAATPARKEPQTAPATQPAAAPGDIDSKTPLLTPKKIAPIRPEVFAAFPATRAPFPGGDLFRAPAAPASWKVSLQKTALPGEDPASQRSKFQRAEVFRGTDLLRLRVVSGKGDPLEKWRVGQESFRYSPSENLATRDTLASGGEEGGASGAFSAEMTAWGDMQELAWIARESFWFRAETPGGALFIFVEEDEEPDPDAPEAAPTPAAEATKLPSAFPETPPAGEPSQPPPGASSAAPDSVNPSLAPDEPAPVPAPKKKRAVIPLPTPDPETPFGLIPGVQLKHSIRAAAIDANTRLPRAVQIAGLTFVYTYENGAQAPEIPQVILEIQTKAQPRPKVDPGVSAVPVP